MDSYRSFFDGEFPREYDAVVAEYGYSYVQSGGTAPWTFEDYVETLTEQMASADDTLDWVGLLSTAAAQAHYIEDLHNPFHLTFNYDGQYTGNNGIHARYEGQMILRHLDDLPFAPSNAEYLPSVLDYTFDGIDLTYQHLVDILAADDQHDGLATEAYYSGMWSDTGGFTQELFQRASEAVANSWYTAWVDAGSPITFLPIDPDFNNDGAVDAADYAVWRAEFGQYGAGLSADADHNLVVDLDDYQLWRSSYGATAQSGVPVSIPEPTASVTLMAAVLSAALKRRPSS